MRLLRWPLALLRLLALSVVLALRQMWAHKTRALLTTIGIIIGVASVTTVIAVLTGLKSVVLSEFQSFGTNKIYVIPERPEEGPLRRAPWHKIRFTPELFEDLKKHCPSVDQLSRVAFMSQTVQFGDRKLEEVQTVGVEKSWHKIENRGIEVGRPFTTMESRDGRAVCLVTPGTRDKLRLKRDASGQSILIGMRLYRIVGVVEPEPQFSLGGQDKTVQQVIIPFNTAWKMAEPWMLGIATCKSPELADEARAEISFFLRRARGQKPGEPNTFRIEVMEKYLEEFKKIALVITIVAAGIVGISLLVGGVGIMNIMLVSVSERTREIGLRKAVGARPSTIMLQFLVEAVTLCLFGGLLGLAVAQGLTSLVASIPSAHLEEAYIPLWAVAVSFGFSAAVGTFFGMFPAIKAARLDPIEALRHE